jgi:putative MATE family efflux protein
LLSYLALVGKEAKKLENVIVEPNKKLINKRVLSFILPMTLDSILQLTAALISMGMIGRIDVVSISVIGISTRVVQIVWALFRGIGTGTTVFVSQCLGAGNMVKLKKVIQQSVISSIILSILIAIIICLKSEIILSIFQPDSTLLAKAADYLRIVAAGLPFLAVMQIIGGSFQGMRKPAVSMSITLFMNLVNIIVGYALIFGKFGFTPMGLRGAAYATVLSQVLAALLGLVLLLRSNGILTEYLNRSFFKIDMNQIKEIYRVGLPTSMEFIFWQLAAVILARSMLTYGETAFAAYQLGMQAEAISYTPAAGFGIAATTFVGQALGAGNVELAKMYHKQIMKGVLLITLAAVFILLFMPENLMTLLTNNREVIKLGAIYLILMGLVEIPQNLTGVIAGSMKGAGYTKIPMIVSGSGLWGVRIPLALLVTYVFKLPIAAIWSVMCIDVVFRFALCIIIYTKRNIYKNNIILG